MVNFQSLLGAGVPITNEAGTAIAVIANGPGKLFGVGGVTGTTSGAVFLQVWDEATIANSESSGTWVATPILELELVGTLAAGGNVGFQPIMPPVPLYNGCVMALSTSGTSYAADSHPLMLQAQIALDPASTLSSTMPSE